MIITHQGGNYFKIQSGELSFLVDPDNQRSYKGTAMVLNTLKPALAEAPAEGEAGPVWIDNQGEYEIKGIRVRGWSAGFDKREHTIYKVRFDDITVGILGYLTVEPSPEVVGELHDADILIVPAGGEPLLPQGVVAKLVRQIEPGIVIPALFKDMKPFLKEMGQPDAAREEKLVVKKKEIAPKAMQVRPIGQ